MKKYQLVSNILHELKFKRHRFFNPLKRIEKRRHQLHAPISNQQPVKQQTPII